MGISINTENKANVQKCITSLEETVAELKKGFGNTKEVISKVGATKLDANTAEAEEATSALVKTLETVIVELQELCKLYDTVDEAFN